MLDATPSSSRTHRSKGFRDQRACDSHHETPINRTLIQIPIPKNAWLSRLLTNSRVPAGPSRTLQRRLARAGTSFEALCDDARRTAAETYLRDTTLSISEVTYLLGYSEPAAFHRAFKRWHGKTPLAFRQAT